MQKIRLICIGTLKFPWARDAAEEFVRRLGVSVDLEVLELLASKQKDPDKQKKEETERIEKALKGSEGDVWILDERGQAMESVAFSRLIGRAKDRGTAVTIILGGAYGLTAEFRAHRNLLKLSDLTLPHELCRVLFLEQLYRATEILKGSGYHH